MSEAAMKTTTIKLPVPLLEQIQEIAKIEDRSVGAQMRVFLADAVTRNDTDEQPETSTVTADA